MKFFFIIIITSLFIKGNAQNNDGTNYHEKYKVRIAKTAEEIKIDGVLSEETWKTADIATGFWQTVYRDDKAAARQTEMRLAYNDQYLFISVTSFDTLPYLGATLKRDTRAGESDGIGVLLDPLNQRTNAFLFGVSAFNAQCEDVYSAAGLDKINWTWITNGFLPRSNTMTGGLQKWLFHSPHFVTLLIKQNGVLMLSGAIKRMQNGACGQKCRLIYFGRILVILAL